MKKLRLVKEDNQVKKGFIGHLMDKLISFFKNEVPEFLSRGLVYGSFCVFFLRLAKLENLSIVFLFMTLTYAIACIIMFEGLHLLRDRNNLSLGSIRHLIIPVLSVLWPLTVCLLVILIADYLIRSHLEEDDDDDDDGDREDLPHLQVV